MRTSARRWIAIDGEGLGRSPHKYVLLAASDARGESSMVEDAEGIGTVAALRFLLSLGTKDATVAGFFLGYDWTMILRELPNAAIYRLMRPELRAIPSDEGGGFTRVRWRGFALHYLSGMMRIERAGASVTVWDLGKFFQCSFVEALKRWDVPSPLAEIEAMKGLRSTFKATDAGRIRAYCLAECKALAELATRLEAAHVSVGLRPRGWHGPGSTASVALRRWGIGSKRGAAPAGVLGAADRAFFGGRFEQSRIGRVEGVTGYDIVSAYPYQALGLPCLEHGTWERTTRERDLDGPDVRGACVRFTLTDTGSQAWAPLPIRLSSGSIVYPRGGASGWTWLGEWRAARRGWWGVEWGGEAWLLKGSCECRPFSGVLPLFRERIALGKNGPGLIIKLATNSIYGKIAQTVGAPQYASRIWAGMITSGTRAQLLDLIASHQSRASVIAVATDGIYSTETLALPTAPMTPDTLGAWEAEPHGAMTFVRPGIYFAHDDATVRARGIGRRTLDAQRAEVSAAIERGDERAFLGTTTAFGGARMTVYKTIGGQLKRSTMYGEWHQLPARISLGAGPKRAPDWSLLRLDGVESRPYSAKHQSADGKLLRLLGNLFDAMRG